DRSVFSHAYRAFVHVLNEGAIGLVGVAEREHAVAVARLDHHRIDLVTADGPKGLFCLRQFGAKQRRLRLKRLDRTYRKFGGCHAPSAFAQLAGFRWPRPASTRGRLEKSPMIRRTGRGYRFTSVGEANTCAPRASDGFWYTSTTLRSYRPGRNS